MSKLWCKMYAYCAVTVICTMHIGHIFLYYVHTKCSDIIKSYIWNFLVNVQLCLFCLTFRQKLPHPLALSVNYFIWQCQWNISSESILKELYQIMKSCILFNCDFFINVTKKLGCITFTRKLFKISQLCVAIYPRTLYNKPSCNMVKCGAVYRMEAQTFLCVRTALAR